MLTKTITLNGEEYRLRAGTTAAAVMYEQVTGRAFDIKTLSDRLTYFWCMLMASNRDKPFMDFYDFLDAMDDNPEAIAVFTEVLEDAGRRTAAVAGTEGDDDKKKD